MNGDFVSIRGLSLSRRMVLQGMASLLSCAVTPNAFAATAKSCKPTERDIIGPFYRFGAPFQTKLAGPNEPGERLIISGKVLSSDCRTRLPNTLIEIWQANKAGQYDTDKPGDFTERVDFHLRGMMLTDQQGNYEVETIMPGRYPVRQISLGWRNMRALPDRLTFILGFRNRCTYRLRPSSISRTILISRKTRGLVASHRWLSSSDRMASSCAANLMLSSPGASNQAGEMSGDGPRRRGHQMSAPCQLLGTMTT